jgi:protein-L-isoaspartate(D-aspartate) O-methyltransferase
MMSRLSGIGMTSSRTRMRMLERLRAEGIRDEAVLASMGEVPRHIFVDEALASRAYEDTALPIGFGQTISQPWIVARMSELARNGRALERVLEIGTGCGYQTAILAKLARHVFSVERLRALLTIARKHMRELHLPNVRLAHADGHEGLKVEAPFDAIVVTAAATHIPAALKEQLAPGGRLIVPMGRTEQHLVVIERDAKGGAVYNETQLDAVRFVPLLPGVG